jgi:hypothetical protein
LVAVTEKGVCQTECLIDWVEPGSALAEDHMQDKPSPNGTEPDVEVQENEREVTKSIFMELLMGTEFEEVKQFSNIFQISNVEIY